MAAFGRLFCWEGWDVGNGQTDLDRLGCEFGRGLAKDVANLREDMGEVKQDVKTLLVAVARVEESVQSSRRNGDRGNGGKRGNNREFWTSVIALAIALVTLAATWSKVWSP